MAMVMVMVMAKGEAKGEAQGEAQAKLISRAARGVATTHRIAGELGPIIGPL